MCVLYDSISGVSFGKRYIRPNEAVVGDAVAAVDRWSIRALLECANTTWVADASCVTLGRHSSRRDLTAPFRERFHFTSTKSVRILSSGPRITLYSRSLCK